MKDILKTPYNRKSFYNKAIVKIENNISYLYSYNTLVAEYNHVTNKVKVNGWYSSTTARHINAFLNLYGFDSCSKQELINYNAQNQ